MTFYTHTFEAEDGGWVAQLKLVHPPFTEDEDGDLEYEETTILVAAGASKEAALLQVRAALNSALGGVELDIMRDRGMGPTIRVSSSEAAETPTYDGYVVYDEEEDEEDGD